MIELLNEDCMELMARYPDKYFDLAIVDPPYGIGADINIQSAKGKNGFKNHKSTNWDESIPNEKYFTELFRVSRNQIIWGGNYFTQFLKPSMCWIVWDKVQREFSFSHGELAWTSFSTRLEIFTYARGNDSGFAPKLKDHNRAGINIHPTQKPVSLYKFCLKNYADPSDKILDTHLGSGSSAIAAHQFGITEFVGCEIDKDYYDAAVKRFNLVTSQTQLF